MRVQKGPIVDGTSALSISKSANADADQSRPLAIVPISDQYIAPTPSKPANDRPILLYNDQCQVCRVLSSWVKKQDASGRDLIDERPIGDDPEALAAINPALDIWTAYEKIHVAMPDGTLKTGGDAIAEVLKRLDKTHWMGGFFDFQVFGKRPFLALLSVAYEILDKARPAVGCESCGGGVVPWWAKPIEWGVKGYKAIRGKSPADPA